ncbi:hypothetical protein PF011_g29946 [Phytophthora fragariae]|uniref:BED-type domain-containing protein n=2 Tax=Phytophthora fragariae TaxID=53985 RepID=A0A6A3GVK4_9STRA|nr:hypothetical protein PF011_g29946 [Phytophthora fragariae]
MNTATIAPSSPTPAVDSATPVSVLTATPAVASAAPVSVLTVTSAMCPQRRGGRKRDPVWSDVVMFEDKTAVCSKCEVVIHELGYTHVERVRHHMTQRCPKRAKTVKISTLFPPALKGLADFHQALMGWAFQKGISFNALQDPAFLFAVQQLHPEATIPTDKAMRNVLLDEAYEMSVARIKQAANGKLVTFSTDAWTDVNGMSVINYVAICGAKTYYLESKYTGSISHDIAFIAADLKRVMVKYHFLHACAVVTDNTSAPGNSSSGTSLGISWLGDLAVDGKAVVKFFKKRHQLNHELQEVLRRNGRRTLALPVETRWGTLEKCFSTLLAAEPFLHEIVSHRAFLAQGTKEQKAKKRVIHDIARSGSFVPNLEGGQKLLEILTKFSRRFERNDTPTSDVYEMFLELPEPIKGVGLTAAEKESFKIIVSDKFKFLYGDAHGVAYVLDPHFLGKEMDTETRVGVENLICNWHGSDSADDSSAELLSYFAYVQRLRDSESRMLKLVLDRKVSPLTFWVGLTQFPLLRAVAVSTSSSACSSAACERSFSAQRFVHSKLRNRLRSDRVGKLVHIYFNSKNTSEEDEEEFFNDVDELLEPSDDEREPESDFLYY